MYEHVLCPTDAQAGTDMAIDHAIAVAAANDATLHVLYVVDSDVYSSYSGDEYVHEFEGLESALEQAGEAAIESVVDRAREAGLDPETTICHGTPHERILEYANEIDADLIVVGSKKRSGEYRRLLGSVADRVARLSNHPVTIVKTPVE